jgi:Tfp pilus assembly protein PilF
MPALSDYLGAAACGFAFLVTSPLLAQQPAATNAPPAVATSTNAPASAVPANDPVKLLADARERLNKNDADGALTDVNQVITLDPKNLDAYVLRGSIYSRKKLWQQSEADFNSALQIAPNNMVVKYNVAEIQFMQKKYDVARPQFVAIQSDVGLGDVAAFKVFLCDLLGGHEDVAAKELDVFNQKAENPSYFYSNAVWSIYHKNIEDARSWLTSAAHVYPARKNMFYASTLKELGYLPLPAPVPK